MQRILFATDGSVSTASAVQMVRHLLDAWPQAELLVLTVTVAPDHLYDALSPDQVRSADEQAEKIEQAAKNEWFPNAVNRLRFRHVYGHQPAVLIATNAEEENADLIVLGSRVVGQPDPLLTGSVSHGVLYCSHVPVMVVKEWKGERDEK